ncbi:restriction endonuclease subunit S [Nostoc sp.]
MDRAVFGSAQPQLTVKGISKFKIPVSSLPEQKAIA